MDLTIQSLVQSPYMRAMAVVPTKSEELVHGIHDHLPPLVKTQVVVPYVRNPGIAGRWVFNIPRRGLWHSATLVVRPRGTITARAGILDAQLNVASTFVEAVENIELFSKQRFIERLIPEAILSEMSYVSPQIENWFQYNYADLNILEGTAIDSSVAWPYVASHHHTGGLHRTTPGGRRPHYVIPLPLSCFTSIKKNFQTLFVENLSLVVTTKNFGYAAISGYDMELHCEYHSFHPNVETVIRNANYKQEIPATLPWHDWIVFDNRLSQSNTLIEYSLESDALISTLLICPQYEHVNSGVKTFKTFQNFYIVVRSLSEILYEGSVLSLSKRYDLILDETEATKNLENQNILDGAYKFYIPVHFGLRRDNERFTGGLALSSITNPRVSIYANEAIYRGSAATGTALTFPPAVTNSNAGGNYNAFDFKVIGKRHFFLRIDSDTGVITRSIES